MQPVFTGMSSYRCLLTWLFDLDALLCLFCGGVAWVHVIFLHHDGVERGQLRGPKYKADIGCFLF